MNEHLIRMQIALALAKVFKAKLYAVDCIIDSPTWYFVYKSVREKVFLSVTSLRRSADQKSVALSESLSEDSL